MDDHKNLRLDKRSLRRYSANRKVRYLQEGNNGWSECTIADISHGGIGIIYTSGELIAIGSTICIEVFFPGQLDPIYVRGNIKWSVKVDGVVRSGLELNKLLDEKLLGSEIRNGGGVEKLKSSNFKRIE